MIAIHENQSEVIHRMKALIKTDTAMLQRPNCVREIEAYI